MSPGTPIVVYGVGGMGREVVEMILAINESESLWDLIGFLDDQVSLAGAMVDDLPVLGDHRWLASNAAAVTLAVGDPERRAALLPTVRRTGRALPTLVHPSATTGRRVVLGEGCLLGAGAVVTTNVRVGASVLVNVGATVSHDSVLEDFATVAPGAHLAGNVVIEEGADIGTGASILPSRRVGAWARVGAGAVVLADVPAHTTAVGCPARVVRRHAPAPGARWA